MQVAVKKLSFRSPPESQLLVSQFTETRKECAGSENQPPSLRDSFSCLLNQHSSELPHSSQKGSISNSQVSASARQR